MSMTNEERKHMGELHWAAAIELWNMGYSKRFIARVYKYKNVASLTTKIAQLRRKYGWFPARLCGFRPVDCHPAAAALA